MICNLVFCRKFLRQAALLIVAFTLLATTFLQRANAQDDDDPPGRVARLGYMQGSVSFEPAGESEWVEAVPNRPMTTGDRLWVDQNSRAELQLGSASIHLGANTGFSFLNLDDQTVQIELSSGILNVRVRELDRDEVFEIDTPNQAFSVSEPGRYRVEASENGDYTVVTIRDGSGESTGNGQSYTLHAGQRTTFSGTSSLNAEVEQIGGQDDFDNWSYARDRRYDDSPSGRYCSRDVVGFQDLDDNGDWEPYPEYGNVWYPRVAAGWAPYRNGHWAWIDPWGWTWVDDAPWGYAPFHYGRWVTVRGRWGWVAGPVHVHPVYAPALVVFVGGGGIGGNVAWFPLGPREVYVPSYRVSRGYVDRVNVSNTTVNTTVINNVYNTTIVRNNTTITNVTYVNRNVRGAVTAVPQRTFATAQPVQRATVAVNPRDLQRASFNARAAVPPQQQAVLGVHANTANRVAAPPRAVASRTVIAKAAPPPPRPSFQARETVLKAHPGQPVPRQEMVKLRPANAPAPMVRQAPPGKPATAINRPGGAQPNQPGAAQPNRPGNPQPNRTGSEAANQPGNRPNNQPGNLPANRPANPPANERPGANNGQPPRGEQPRPENPTASDRPQPNRPEPNRPTAQPNNRLENNNPPAQPTNRPENNRPQPKRPENTQPNNRPANPPETKPENRPENNRPQPNRPEPNRPQPNKPAENRPQPNRPPANQPNEHPENNRTQPSRPTGAQPENRPQPNRPPAAQPSNRQENNRPATERPQTNRPPSQPNNRPEAKPSPQPKRPPQNQPPAKDEKQKDQNKDQNEENPKK